MNPSATLRPARDRDLAFCRRLYYEAMRPTIERIRAWREDREDAEFARQWSAAEVSIVVGEAGDIGWMQIARHDRDIFLNQIYLDASSRNRGIGTRLVQSLLHDADRQGLAVVLNVVKDNPALCLYERLGFRRIGEELHKFNLRRDPD